MILTPITPYISNIMSAAPLTLSLDYLSKENSPLLPLALSSLISSPNATSSGTSSAAAQLNVVQADSGSEPTLEAGGERVTGTAQIVQKLLTLFATSGIYGTSQEQSNQVEQFLAEAHKVATSTFATLGGIADDLDQHLALRTFFVGHSLTAADAAVWAAIRGNSPAIGLVRKGTHKHLARWFTHLEALPQFSNVLSSIAGASKNKMKTQKEASSFDLFLGDNPKEGTVVTRFPPEPSGYLHVGHAKAAILNQYFAKKYKGKLILRFDDTNPSKEKMEFEDAIVEDLALMGIKPDMRSHTSEFFDELYRLAIQIITQGDAYCDDTEQEQMRAERMDGIASKNREASVEQNLERFAEMTKGTPEGARWCLRAKMSVDNPNKAMRDPVIYRCNLATNHHLTG